MTLKGHKKRIKPLYKKASSMATKYKVGLLVSMLFFSSVGTAAILLTNASSTNSVSVDPTATDVQSPARSVADPNASGGSLVEFLAGSTVGATDPFDLPDATYTAPTSNVKFVATNGSDANAGTLAAPYATIDKAVQNIAAGGTVVLRGGTYQQKVTKLTKAVVFQRYNNEKPWIDGSVNITSGYNGTTWNSSVPGEWRLDNWAPSGICRSGCLGSIVSGGVTYYVDGSDTNGTAAQNPAAKLVDLVFYNDKPLTQVAQKSQLAAGKFFVDYATNSLYIADSPSATDAKVEASIYANAINAQSLTGVKILGVGVRRFASTSNATTTDQAAVFGTGNILIENVSIVHNAGAGIGINNAAGAILQDSKLAYNGFLGIRGNAGNGLTIRRNRIAYNNTENFVQGGTAAVAAGAKFTGISNFVAAANELDNNNATGLWCDLGCNSAKWVRNWVHDNYWNGLHYEVSYGGILASNRIARNNKAGNAVRSGIRISGSPTTVVANNTFVDNYNDIGVYHDGRSVNVGGVQTVIKEVYLVNNLSIRTTATTQLPNTFFNSLTQSSTTVPSFFLPSPPGGVDHNGFWRAQASRPSTLYSLGGTPTTNDIIYTGTGADGVAGSADDVAVPLTNIAANDLSLTAQGLTQYQGTGLSAAVVSAICIDLPTTCVTANTPVRMGYLQ